MKLSTETVNLLKNFSNINSGIVFRPGNTIKTISTNKNILAEATIKENIPCEFGIYDLSKFINVLSMYKEEVDVEFKELSGIISGMNGRSNVDYRFCAAKMINAAPEKPVAMPEAEINFVLTQSDFDWIIRTASVLGSPNIAVVSDGTKIELMTYDASNDSESTNTLNVGEGTGDKFKMIFKTEALKLIPGTYEVKISSKGVSHFKNKDIPIQYWITIESGSTFSKG
jgi:hypothetical protein